MNFSATNLCSLNNIQNKTFSDSFSSLISQDLSSDDLTSLSSEPLLNNPLSDQYVNPDQPNDPYYSRKQPEHESGQKKEKKLERKKPPR